MAWRAIAPLATAGGGAIVLVSSIWGREAGRLARLQRRQGRRHRASPAARDLAAQHIRVNTIAPGSILFPGGGWDRRQQADPAGIAAFVARELPFGRFGTPEEVADVAVFLASARARWITGACVVVDGGQSRAF